LIYSLFHNQNVAGIFHFVIVWSHQLDCDVFCNATVWRRLNFLLYFLEFHKKTKYSSSNVSDKIMCFIFIIMQLQRTSCYFRYVRQMNGWPSDFSNLHTMNTRKVLLYDKTWYIQGLGGVEGVPLSNASYFAISFFNFLDHLWGLPLYLGVKNKFINRCNVVNIV
jgi:hypothetical protein